MAENQESNDRYYEISHQFRSLNRRVKHLEDKIDLINSEFKEFRNEVNQKLDTILKHINRLSNKD